MVDEEQNSIGPGKVPELAMSKMDKYCSKCLTNMIEVLLVLNHEHYSHLFLFY